MKSTAKHKVTRTHNKIQIMTKKNNYSYFLSSFFFVSQSNVNKHNYWRKQFFGGFLLVVMNLNWTEVCHHFGLDCRAIFNDFSSLVA